MEANRSIGTGRNDCCVGGELRYTVLTFQGWDDNRTQREVKAEDIEGAWEQSRRNHENGRGVKGMKGKTSREAWRQCGAICRARTRTERSERDKNNKKKNTKAQEKGEICS